jgi:hypothetical protein
VLQVVRVLHRHLAEGDLGPQHARPLVVLRDVVSVRHGRPELVAHGDVLGVVVTVALERRHAADAGEVAVQVHGHKLRVVLWRNPTVTRLVAHERAHRGRVDHGRHGRHAALVRQPPEAAGVRAHQGVRGVARLDAGGAVQGPALRRVRGLDPVARPVHVRAVPEKLRLLLHPLHSPQHLERVHEPRHRHLLVVLVAHHVLHPVALLHRLLHLLLALLTAHRHSHLHHRHRPLPLHPVLRRERPLLRVPARVIQIILTRKQLHTKKKQFQNINKKFTRTYRRLLPTPNHSY